MACSAPLPAVRPSLPTVSLHVPNYVPALAHIREQHYVAPATSGLALVIENHGRSALRSRQFAHPTLISTRIGQQIATKATVTTAGLLIGVLNNGITPVDNVDLMRSWSIWGPPQEVCDTRTCRLWIQAAFAWSPPRPRLFEARHSYRQNQRNFSPGHLGTVSLSIAGCQVGNIRCSVT
jgi:hypothetical protein